MKYLVTMLLCLSLVSPTYAALTIQGKLWEVINCGLGIGNTNGCIPLIIFSENFDAQADWEPAGIECNGKSVTCGDDVPPNWTYYRATDLWNSKTGYPTKEPALKITSAEGRGGTGKALVKSQEASYVPPHTFEGDGQLMKSLGADYEEIYITVWIKFDPTWQWEDSSPMLKMVRAMHFDGPDGVANPFLFFDDGFSAPYYIFDLQQTSLYGFRHKHAPRCDPQITIYYCDPYKLYNEDFRFTVPASPPAIPVIPADPVVNISFAESSGDGNWHKYEWRLKMNTAGNSDGIFQFWMDDVMYHSVTTIEWRVGTTVGWNAVSLGGNSNNWFDPVVANQSEQWFAFDDLTVSTQRLGN